MLLPGWVGAEGADTYADPYEARRSKCMGWMMTGYPTGLDENWCVSEFNLPSAFLIKCARAQQLGFETQGQRAACRVMFLRAAEAVQDGHVLN